jgi:hypothetical protein
MLCLELLSELKMIVSWGLHADGLHQTACPVMSTRICHIALVGDMGLVL